MNLFVLMNACVCVYMSACVCLYEFVCVNECACVCVCVCVHECVCVCVCVCVCEVVGAIAVPVFRQGTRSARCFPLVMSYSPLRRQNTFFCWEGRAFTPSLSKQRERRRENNCSFPRLSLSLFIITHNYT